MNIRNFLDIKSLFFDNKSLKQTIFKNAFWLVLAEGITRILKLFLIIYVARILGATEYGKFTFALSFVSLLAIFGDLGLDPLMIREISREEEKEEDFPFVLSLRLILILVIFLLIFIGSFFVTSSAEIQKLIWTIGAYVLINTFSATIYAFFRAKRRMEYESFAKILQSIVVTAVGFFVLFNFPSVQNLGFSYLFASSSILFLIISFFHSRIHSLKLIFDKKKWKNFLTLSWPVALYGIFGVVYHNIDSIIMGHLNQITQVGWYNAALRLANITLILTPIISTSFFPVLSKFFKESEKKLQKTWSLYFQLMLSLAIPLVVGGVFLAPKLIDLVYDPSYFPSILVFRILILFVGISFISGPLSKMLFVFNQQKKILLAALFGMITNIVLNLILIPRYSLYGAAFVLLITYSLMFILLLKFFLESVTIRFFDFNFFLFLIGVVVSSIVMFFVISYSEIYKLHVLFVIMIGITIYLVSLFGYKKAINL